MCAVCRTLQKASDDVERRRMLFAKKAAAEKAAAEKAVAEKAAAEKAAKKQKKLQLLRDTFPDHLTGDNNFDTAGGLNELGHLFYRFWREVYLPTKEKYDSDKNEVDQNMEKLRAPLHRLEELNEPLTLFWELFERDGDFFTTTTRLDSVDYTAIRAAEAEWEASKHKMRMVLIPRLQHLEAEWRKFEKKFVILSKEIQISSGGIYGCTSRRLLIQRDFWNPM